MFLLSDFLVFEISLLSNFICSVFFVCLWRFLGPSLDIFAEYLLIIYFDGWYFLFFYFFGALDLDFFAMEQLMGWDSHSGFN
jgi:hypothetical protein